MLCQRHWHTQRCHGFACFECVFIIDLGITWKVKTEDEQVISGGKEKRMGKKQLQAILAMKRGEKMWPVAAADLEGVCEADSYMHALLLQNRMLVFMSPDTRNEYWTQLDKRKMPILEVDTRLEGIYADTHVLALPLGVTQVHLSLLFFSLWQCLLHICLHRS